MIELRRGDLLDANAEALVNPVHCAGIMKRGLCRQFKERFPENTKQYEAACDAGSLRPGDVIVHDRGGLFGDQDGPRYVLNVATKDHWTDTARLADIETGIEAVVNEVKTRDVDAVAVPALGCGGGGLNWPDVRPLLVRTLATLDTRDILIYAPRSTDTTSSTNGRTRNGPTMTQGRALLLAVLDAYAAPADDLRPPTAHNLAYLLQCAGEDLHLDFEPEPDRHGVRAPGLAAVLERINGHFVEGYNPDHRDAPFRLRPSSVAEAKDLVAAVSTASDRLNRLRVLIDALPSDEDLERSSIVLWIMRHDREARRRAEAAVQALHDRSQRDDGHFSTEQITAAWRRLRNDGWGD